MGGWIVGDMPSGRPEGAEERHESSGAEEHRSGMLMLDSVRAGRDYARDQHRRGRVVGLVPTMGYLHAGHMALVDAIRPLTDVVALSIFVNPLQFGVNEDFDRYPRDMDHDWKMAESHGVDAIFAPDAADMYPVSTETYVEVPALARVLDGVSRPTHFRGVTTVVAKLFHAMEPDVAAFGQKDAQQSVIVKRMVTELLFPIQIVVVPTVREPDGLALSSRNAYLTDRERQAAVVLWAALNAAREAVREGERHPQTVEAAMRTTMSREPLCQTDYATVLALETLSSLDRIEGRVLMAVAARFGKARLIDNVCLKVDGSTVTEILP